MTRLVVALLGVVAACRPEFEQDESLLSTPRVLAVKSEPAEAPPGSPVVFTAFVAAPPSLANLAAPAWSFCTAPKPPTVDTVVSPACLESSWLLPVAEGFTITAPTPREACTLFGPNAATSGLRPRDPDVTGGYFQPLRVDLLGAVATFHLQRVQCGLADSSADIAAQFGRDYVPNGNPRLGSLVATLAGHEADLGQIPARAQVELSVSWAVTDAESYVYFDRALQAITTRRESMRVAWYVSAGKLLLGSTARAESDPALSSSNLWTAPDSPGRARLWIVLRDSRGGVDFAARDLEVVR